MVKRLIFYNLSITFFLTVDARSNGWVGGGQLFFLLYSSELIEIYFLLNHFFRTVSFLELINNCGRSFKKKKKKNCGLWKTRAPNKCRFFFSATTCPIVASLAAWMRVQQGSLFRLLHKCGLQRLITGVMEATQPQNCAKIQAV